MFQVFRSEWIYLVKIVGKDFLNVYQKDLFKTEFPYHIALIRPKAFNLKSRNIGIMDIELDRLVSQISKLEAFYYEFEHCLKDNLFVIMIG